MNLQVSFATMSPNRNLLASSTNRALKGSNLKKIDQLDQLRSLKLFHRLSKSLKDTLKGHHTGVCMGFCNLVRDPEVFGSSLPGCVARIIKTAKGSI